MAWAAGKIAAAGSGTPRLDSELILAHVLGIGREELLARPDAAIVIEENDAAMFREAVGKRAGGLAVAYITGRKAFWRHEFEVSPAVLIPKPDTETLVERAEDALESLFARKGKGGGPCVLDMCTGSGCVAISIKFDFPRALVAGADISKEALLVAEKNARKILMPQGEGEGVAWLCSDLREGLPAPPFFPQEISSWDMIVANPPYVPSSEARALLSDGRGEPLLALDGGKDGLSLMRRLVLEAPRALAPGGFLLAEAGEYNAEAAAALFREAGFSAVRVHKDLSGRDRVVEGRASL